MICDIHGCELTIETYYQVPYCPKCVCNQRNKSADTREVENVIGCLPVVQITLELPTLN